MQWLKAVKWKKTWPYRPPVSDDDEGITAVEATGGESVQLQRVQHAVFLTFHKHPEDWAANMRLFKLQDSPLLCGHDILKTGEKSSVYSTWSLCTTCRDTKYADPEVDDC